MANQAEAHDSGQAPDDVAVVTSSAETDDQSPHPDVMRAIRYLLYRYELSSGSAHIPQMIAVVSSSMGDGVTTVSRALAEILASERRSKVCRINFGEANSSPAAQGWSTPGESSAVLNTSHPVGGAKLLGGRDDVPVRLLPTDNLPALRAGTVLGGPDLDDLMSELARDYRYVVLDTPPLHSQSDSIGFLRHADAYLLVTRQGSTTVNQVKALADELRAITPLGAILNDYRTRTPRFIRRFFSE